MLLLQMNFVAFAVILTNANAAVAGLGDLAEHHVEIVSATDDGGTLSVRTRRAAGGDVCKYRKGAWSDCDPLVLLMTRQDTLKERHSSAGCEKKRRITKNCKDKDDKNIRQSTCVFEKPKTVSWSECQEAGVRQRLLRLVKEKGNAGCPKEKVLSKKCKSSKNKKEGNEKCEFEEWSEWSKCVEGKTKRARKILKGNEKKSCMKKSLQKKNC